MLHFDSLQVRDYSYEQNNLAFKPIQKRGLWVSNWFSNFQRVGCIIEYRGCKTNCLEIAFVAAKNPDTLVTYRNYDTNIQYDNIPFIQLCFILDDPGRVKRLGKSPGRKGLIEARPEWDYIKLAAMDNFLRQRFRPGHPDTDKLVNMIKCDRIEMVSDDPIMELNNWGDRIWGVTIDGWFGRNGLGRLLHLIAVEFINTGDIKFGAPEHLWIQRQEELIHLLNNTIDGGVPDVFDRTH